MGKPTIDFIAIIKIISKESHLPSHSTRQEAKPKRRINNRPTSITRVPCSESLPTDQRSAFAGLG